MVAHRGILDSNAGSMDDQQASLAANGVMIVVQGAVF
jgi:hypothetical protein